MSISLICWGGSLLILLPLVLSGIFGGIRKGLYRSAVKLGALVFSVILSLVIALCLRGVVADILSGALIDSLPEALQSQSSILDLGTQMAASVALLCTFWLIFSIVRLLMLIPQKIVTKKLPQHPAEPQEAQPVAPAYTPVAETTEAEPTVDPDFPLPQYVIETPVVQTPATNKALWNFSAALCGVLSSLLFFSVWMMPISGIVTRGGNSVYRIASTLEQEGMTEYTAEIGNYARSISTAPLFVVTDLFTGKTIFEPLTTISTEFGTINLSKEIKTGTNVLCNLLPAALHISENGSLSKDDAELLAGAVKSISESEFMLSVGTWGANFLSDSLEKESDSQDSVSKQALNKELADVLENMTPEALSNDLDTLIQLTAVLAESPVLKVLSKDNGTPNPADLADKETLQNTFAIMYDNEHTKSLLIPLINLGTEFVFKSIGAKPVYSDADIDQLSRDQILDEADRLCNVAENISAFTQSMEGDDKKLADYEMASAGKALDSLKESVIFGNQYSEVVHSVTSASGSNQNSELMESLGDAIVEADSAEKLMNSAQNVVIMSDALEDTTAKGRENEKLVSSLDVLLNDTTPKDADALSGIAGEHFLDNRENLDSDTKQQMLDDSMKALSAVCAEGTDDVEAEADAVQTFRDITESKSSNVFEEMGEEKAVNDFLNSKLAMEMLKNLNAENRDYGIREKLTEENKSNLSAALEKSSADAAKKQIVGQFFGIN